MAYCEQLFIDCFHSGVELVINENAKPGSRVRFRGKFQEAEAINKNKRMYPYKVLDENVKRLMEAMEDRRLVGELDHPTDSIVHFANASHIITKLWWEGKVLMGEGEILSTPSGIVLQALINDGVKIGISSRGVGSGSVNEDGIFEIGDSYKLITFDVVADPSTYAAFQEKVAESARTSPSLREGLRNISRSSVNSVVKNENARIDTVNKDVLVALLSGFVKSQTEKVKSRLG